MDDALTAASLTAGRVSAAVVKNDKNVRPEFASSPGIIAAPTFNLVKFPERDLSVRSPRWTGAEGGCYN